MAWSTGTNGSGIAWAASRAARSNELAGSGHVDRVGSHELAADAPLVAVERLDDEKLDALQPGP